MGSKELRAVRMRASSFPFVLLSAALLFTSSHADATEELTYSRNLSIIALDVLPGMPSSFQNLTCRPVKTDAHHAVYACDITMGTEEQADAQTSRFIAADLPEDLIEKAEEARFVFAIRSALTEDGIRTYPVYIEVDRTRLSAKEGQDVLEAFKEDFSHWFQQADKSWKKFMVKRKREQKPAPSPQAW